MVDKSCILKAIIITGIPTIQKDLYDWCRQDVELLIVNSVWLCLSWPDIVRECDVNAYFFVAVSMCGATITAATVRYLTPMHAIKVKHILVCLPACLLVE